MSPWLTIVRTQRYGDDLVAVGEFIEQNNPDAALALLLHIEDQVDGLADPK